MSKDTGGPAFPRPYSQEYADSKFRAQEGMTLRDYFAAKAMQSFIQIGLGELKEREQFKGKKLGEVVAIQAYKMADMMLAERNN